MLGAPTCQATTGQHPYLHKPCHAELISASPIIQRKLLLQGDADLRRHNNEL